MRLSWVALFCLCSVFTNCTTSAVDESAQTLELGPGNYVEDECMPASAKVECGEGRKLVSEGCEEAFVRCAFECVDAKTGATQCRGNQVAVGDDCPTGKVRCVPTPCVDGRQVQMRCPEGQELTSDGCPVNYVQCSPDAAGGT
jgi:hypothetical protein